MTDQSMDEFQTEYESLRESLKTVEVRMRLLFEDHFEFIEYKQDIKNKDWIKYTSWVKRCAVGEHLQTATAIYRRIK